jgi:predicted metalloprotease with PDZ domain
MLAARYPAGTQVPFTVERAGNPVTVDLRLDTREQGALGIAFGRTDLDAAEIAGVVPGGPADQAGLKPGDVVVEVAGQPVQNRREMGRALPFLSPGSRVPMTVRRDDRELGVVLEAIPIAELQRLQEPPPLEASGETPEDEDGTGD